MSSIFWSLLILTAACAGGFIYNLTRSARLYKLERDQKVALSYGAASKEARAADYAFSLLRWTCIFAALTAVWGTVEGVIRLLS